MTAATTHFNTVEEWKAEGERRFGPDVMRWRFVCPACGHVASVQEWKAVGAPEDVVAYSCVGRWAGADRVAFESGRGPCDYAGGGLFQINPVRIGDRESGVFAFADDEE